MHAYFQKNLFQPIQIQAPPEKNTGMILVIPCFDEPDIVLTLQSLHHNEPINGKVEVIIVINAAEGAPLDVLRQNEKSVREIEEWLGRNSLFYKVFILRIENLPSKHAGVGLARKIGMDEAAWRFIQACNPNGIIVCLDADCTVAPDYLASIEHYFFQYPKTKAASIYFEHQLDEKMEPAMRNGIIQYELHLRYYRQALKYAGYPSHYHTIGSSMCVRYDVYLNAGGMNRRKAGEDFYFLHKIMPLGNFGEINSTTVYPLPRISERVPFGTGRAMKEWMKNPAAERHTYAPQIFEDLKFFLNHAPNFYQTPETDIEKLIGKMPVSVPSFLQEMDFKKRLKEMNANTSRADTFMQRFYRLFDGFTILKMVHSFRDNHYANITVTKAAKILLEKMQIKTLPNDAEGLLRIFRMLDKSA